METATDLGFLQACRTLMQDNKAITINNENKWCFKKSFHSSGSRFTKNQKQYEFN
jgi:hypothetical protein